jgi:phage baseplate assembly protein W
MEYLSLPLELREGYFSRATLHESITHSIGLILSTRKGSIPFDPDYGCDVWEREYSDFYTANKADLRASLRNAIDRCEKRMYNLSVSFAGVESSTFHPIGLAVKVKGNYREDGDEKTFEGTFIIG